MAIVKQFEDPEFLIDYYKWVDTDQLKGSHFYWGLGDDGELYCQCATFITTGNWVPINYGNLFPLPISALKRVVKEFGHLLVFL
jgi:hypothetical protein